MAHIHGILRQRAGVLEHGHGLQAVDDVLHGGDLRILAGDVVAIHVRVAAAKTSAMERAVPSLGASM